MRRILVSISEQRDYGDVTTLANPEIVERIRELVQGKEKKEGAAEPASS